MQAVAVLVIVRVVCDQQRATVKLIGPIKYIRGPVRYQGHQKSIFFENPRVLVQIIKQRLSFIAVIAAMACQNVIKLVSPERNAAVTAYAQIGSVSDIGQACTGLVDEPLRDLDSADR